MPPRLLVRLCVALSVIVGSGVVLVGSAGTPVHAAADPQVPVAQIALNDVVYDRYEPVIIDLGAIGFFPSCPTGGVRDFIYPWADVYIVRGRPAIGKLTDVNGKPNTVAGFGGGGFFDEVIGYGGVKGLLSGTYSIVVDECQDGNLDYNDSVFPDIFRVTTRTSVDPLLGIGTLKAGAGKRAVSWENRGRAWEALLLMQTVLGYATPFLTNPPLMAIGIGISSFVSSQFQATSLAGFPDPKVVAAVNMTNMGRHYRGIEADPPDPNFAGLTTLDPVVVAPPVFDDPIFESAARISAVSTTEEVLAAALLHSIERYQGAEAAGDGSMALQHARQAQDFAAQLAAHLRVSAPVYADAATAIENDSRPIDQLLSDLGGAVSDIFANGLTAEQESFAARNGISRSQLAVELSQIDRLDLATLDVATMAGGLRALSADGLAYADELDVFAVGVQASVDALTANPDVFDAAPHADAGGPYATTVGSAVNVDASASAAGVEPIASYAWDLDGDGAFDDGSAATVSFTPTAPRVGLVGVLVTGEDGSTDVAYSQLIVSGAVPVAITSSSPADDLPIVLAGTSQPFEFTPTTGAVTWRVDGVEVATGTSFTYSPTVADLGVRFVTAVADLGDGQGVARSWTVQVQAPDNDTDGYPSNLDCDDADPTVYPGAPELLDGKDNDCNPASPDGGTAPTVEAGAPIAGLEGDAVSLSGAKVTAGLATPPFTATVDWGDGTTEPASVSGSNVTAAHAYVDDGNYPIEVCATSKTGMTACDVTTAAVQNVAADPTLATLFDWAAEDLPGNQGAPEWIVAPDGLSVLQTKNSRPSFFVSDTALTGTEASITIGVETSGDDDFIGFVVGADQGMTTDPNARYLLVDWKQSSQAYISCGGSNGAVGLAVSLVEGIPTEAELWSHADCDPFPANTVTELARATNLGSTGWADNGQNRFRFVYTLTRFQLYVDEVLEIDITSDLITGDFPTGGGLGFYNESQDHVRYSGYEITAINTVEGTPATLAARFADPGRADTHIGRFDYGDGMPVEAAEITETDGAGTAVARHTYAQDGDYDAQACITDDDGATSCEQVIVRVANAAPVVDAGADRSGGPTVTLVDSSFTDLGVEDSHTATVDWGDGTGPESASLESAVGRGVVEGDHVYAAAGSYTVTVCVTDDGGAADCDSFEVEVDTTNQAPTASTTDDLEVPEGTPVEQGVGFLDGNPDDVQTITVDWGDGTTGPVTVQQRPGIGSGSVSHTYADNGVYAAQFTVCDSAAACDAPSADITVTNVPPTVTLDVTTPSSGGLGVSLTAPFEDPGTADTHTATIDWGDGTTEPWTPGTGAGFSAALSSGQVAGTHSYATAGSYTVRVCVTDDDLGTGCANQTVAVSAAQTASTTTTTTTTTTTSSPTSTPTTPPTTGAPPMGGLPATGNSGLTQPLTIALLFLGLGGVLVVIGATRRRPARR